MSAVIPTFDLLLINVILADCLVIFVSGNFNLIKNLHLFMVFNFLKTKCTLKSPTTKYFSLKNTPTLGIRDQLKMDFVTLNNVVFWSFSLKTCLVEALNLLLLMNLWKST